MALRDALYPVGTYEEVVAMGGNPLKVPTCSAPSKFNRGCSWYFKCPARAFRDKKEGRQGPATGVVFVQLSDDEGAHAANVEMACYDFHVGGLYERRKQVEETGEIIIIRGWEGDDKQYDFREATHAQHRKTEPKCPACLDPKTRCNVVEEFIVSRKIIPFERPRLAFKSEARGAAIREELIGENEERARTAMLERRVTPPASPPEPKEPPAAQA